MVTANAHKRFVSLRVRLLGLLVLVLVPWLALIAYTQADERDEAVANVNRDATRLMALVTGNQAAQIEAARRLLSAFTRLPQLQAGDPQACHAFLAQMLVAYPAYQNLGLIERNGNIACSAVVMDRPINVADRNYFRKVMETGQFAISGYQTGRVTQLPTIAYGYPMFDAAGDTRAVLFASQALNWLTTALADVEFPRGGMLVVVDGDGTVLARMPDAGEAIGKPLPERQVLATLARQRDGGVFEADDAQGVARLWVHAPLIAGHDLHAAIGVPRSVAFAEINRRLARNLAVLGLVTMLATVAAWYGGTRLLRQVDALVAATRQLASGDRGARASVVGSRSELSLLADAFNAMAATLETRDRELRLAEEKTRAAEIELAVNRSHLEIAKEIQRSLLPQDPLSWAGVQVAGRCIPAADVGGDYFGYFPHGPDGVDSLIGDVSGHGVGAALLMAEARSTFLAERLAEPSAAGILARLNEVLYDDLDAAGHFITACCATVDVGTREVRYANAGHPPALLLRAGDACWTVLEAEGMPLGTRRAIEFAEVRIALRAGDVLVFYTDGITETRNEGGLMFGVERLGAIVVAHRDKAAESVVTAVLAALDAFRSSRQPDDDVTIVVMKLAAQA